MTSTKVFVMRAGDYSHSSCRDGRSRTGRLSEPPRLARMHATCTPRGKRLQPCERVDAHAQRGDLKIREVIAHFRLSFFATSSTRAIDDRLLRDLVLAATDSRSPLSCPTVLHEREGGDGDSHSDEGGRGKVMRLFPDEGVAHVARRAGASVAG